MSSFARSPGAGLSNTFLLDDAGDVSRSSTNVETLYRERRRLRVLARCLAATVFALLARIVVSGFSAATVTLAVTLALLFLVCVRLSLAVAAAAARMDVHARRVAQAPVRGATAGALLALRSRSARRRSP